MSNFTRQEIVRRDLGGGDWVDLRRGVSWGDVTDMVDGALDMDVERSRLRKVLAGRMQTLQMVSAIEAWGGPGFQDEQGQPVPVSFETIRRLTQSKGRQIATLVQELNPDLGTEEAPEEVKDEAAAGRPSSPAGAAV